MVRGTSPAARVENAAASQGRKIFAAVAVAVVSNAAVLEASAACHADLPRRRRVRRRRLRRCGRNGGIAKEIEKNGGGRMRARG